MTIRSDVHGGLVQAARPAVVQNLTVGAASVACAPFQNTRRGAPDSTGAAISLQPWLPQYTTHIRLVSNTGCWVAFGAAGVVATVASGSIYLPANTPEYFWVVPGEIIAVIQDSAAGVLNIAELAN